MDRIEEALAQAKMLEYCEACGIAVELIRGPNQRQEVFEMRVKLAIYLCSVGVRRRVVAKVMHRHYDMIRYYTKPTLRERRKAKFKVNTERLRRASDHRSVNIGLT